MRKNIYLIALAALALASCKPIVSTTTVRQIESKSGFVIQPMILEMDEVCQTRVVDTVSSDLFSNPNDESGAYGGGQLPYGNFDENLKYMKEQALAHCAIKHGCDMIVNPTFYTFQKGRKYFVVITGYPAKVKKIRPATENDTWMTPFYN